MSVSISVSNASSTGKSVDSSIEGYGSFVTRTRYLAFNLFFLANKEAQQRAPRLRNVLFVLELLQFFTFIFGPGITDWGKDTSSPLKYISYIRIFAELSFKDHSAVFWCLFVYLLVYLIVGVELAFNSNASSTRRFKVFTFLSSVVGPILYLPFLNIILAFLSCTNDERSVHFGREVSCRDSSFLISAIFACFMAVTLIGMTGMSCFLIRDFHYDKRQLYCRSDSRLLVLFFIVKTILTLAQQYLFHLSANLNVGIYNWIGIASSFGLFSYCVFFLPFYNKSANYIFCGFMSASFLGFMCGFVASTINQHNTHSINVLIAFMIMVVPFTAVTLLFVRFFRIQKLYGWSYTPVGNFARAFEAEICTRGIRQADVIDEDQIINTFTLGIDLFPKDAYLKACYALYLLEKNNDFALLTLILERLRTTPNIPMDVKFVIFCMEKERLGIALAQDGGAEEIHAKLNAVKKHSNRAKMWMKRFWDMLLKEEDLQSLPDVVANMDTEENKAEAILTKLRENFPRNVAILRHYAVFLERVKHDPDSAQVALRLADDMEEEKTTRHRNKSNKKKEKEKVKDSKYIEIREANDSSSRSSNSTVRFSAHSGEVEPVVNLPNTVPEDGDFGDNEPVTFNNTMSFTTGLRTVQQELTARSASNQMDDKASTFSGSSISFSNLKSMKRADVLRYRKYKYLTENSRSKALGRLTIAINVTLLLLLANVIAVFASTQYMITTFDGSISDVNDASVAKIYLHEGALETQKMRALVLGNPNGNLSQHREYLLETMETLDSLVTHLFADKVNDETLEHGWSDPIYDAVEWDLLEHENRVTKKSLWDSVSEFVWRARQIAALANEDLLHINQSVPLRYVLDNAPESIYYALSDLVVLYHTRNNQVSTQLTTIVSVLIPTTFVILTLLGIFLLYPAVKEIKLERAATLRLFLSVPKSCISSIVNKLKTEDDQAGDDLTSEVSEISNMELKEEFVQLSAQAVPVLRSFVLKYLISLILVFAALCVIAFIGLFSLQKITEQVVEVAVAAEERVLVTRLQFASYCLNFSPYDKFDSTLFRNRMLTDTDALDNLDFSLRFGDKDLSLPGKFYQEPYLMEIGFGRSCPNLAKYNLTCTGYISILDLLTDRYERMARYNESRLTPFDPDIAMLNFIDDNYVDPWGTELVEFYLNRARKDLHDVDVVVIVLFVLLLPSLIIILLVLRPIVKRIRLESTRTVKMLLMVPFEVIDSIHPVRDFLNTGQHVLKINKNKQSAVDTSVHDDLMRVVFMESDHAMAVTSPLGEIDVFNPHAESLFGYNKKEVLGNAFALLLPDSETVSLHSAALQNLRKIDGKEKREVIEIMGRHKNQQLIPIKITMLQAKVTGKAYVLHYIEDMSRVNKMQREAVDHAKAFDAAKSQMKNFMYNMFPHSIAEQLLSQNNCTSENQNQSHSQSLMAEEYKEVTILFADIVGFTNMCSHLEPAVLLVILNGIFLKWDALVEKHGVQKIKTIGDCYMVAAGLPERTIDHAEKMLEFAMDMIEALDIYNRTNEFLLSRGLTLSLRVGINTGPVVAGIIGHSRICFDLWGDAVNVASRMESTSLEGRIQVSQTTHSQTKNNYEFEERGTVEVKGKGVMLTYLLVGKRFQETPGGTLRDMRFMKHISAHAPIPIPIPIPAPVLPVASSSGTKKSQ